MGSIDGASFREVVVATAPSLFRLAARLLGSEQEAEDVLQDSYVKAWDAMKQGKFDERARVETWLYRIVTNCALDALRRRRRARASGPLSEDMPDPGQRTDRGAALRELASWLADLPEDQQAAIVLKEMDGMTSAEIGKILECSEGAVEQKLLRARTTLRGRMDRG